LAGERVAAFLTQLDTTDFHRNGASTEQQEILVDAATFLIQMVANDAVVTITPNGALDPPLQRAAYDLHSVVSRCAGAEVPTVEQHDF
jgi:hypothetical protein